MISIITSIFSWLSQVLSTILNLTIPSGVTGLTITIRSIVIFLALSSLAWQVIKMFLEKGHLGNRNGKD